MKRKISFVLIASLFAAASAFAQAKPAVWKEMKSFHYFMSTSFHPSEEGNLAPLKQKADSMLTVAKQWQASPIPDTYKPTETKDALQKLVAACEDLKASVTANAADDELKRKIAKAHDVFHTIVKECKKEEEHH